MKNVIPSLQDYNPDLIYRFDDPEVVRKFNLNPPYQRPRNKDTVRDAENAFLNGGDVPEIVINLPTLNSLDGSNRTQGFLNADEHGGCKSDLKVRFEVVPPEEEFTRFLVLNSGHSVTPKVVANSALSMSKPNITKVREFCMDKPLLMNKKHRLLAQNVENLIFGTLKGKELKENGDYPNVTDADLFTASKVYDDVSTMLGVIERSHNKITGTNVRALMGLWRDVLLHWTDEYKKIQNEGIENFAVRMSKRIPIGDLGKVVWKNVIETALAELN